MKSKMLILTLLFISFQSCEFNVSTANISDVQICTEISDDACTDNNKTFPLNANEIYTTAKLNNAPEGTKLTISWQYDNSGQWFEIDKVNLVYTNGKDKISSSLSSPTNGWPKGKYRVVYTLESDNSEPITKEFSIN